MTTIYLVRHAEAEGNWRRLFQGHTDSEVSDKGRKQLEYLAQRFRDIHLDAIYSSPLKRTYATAQALNHDNLPIHTDRGLIEIDGGKFESQPFDELPRLFPEEDRIWHEAFWDFCAPEGESVRQVYERVRDTIAKIVRENEGKTVGIASHGCAIRNYQCYACGWPVEEIGRTVWCDNTAVSKIEYDDSLTPRIVYLNDTSHLPGAASTFATQDWWKETPERPKEPQNV